MSDEHDGKVGRAVMGFAWIVFAIKFILFFSVVALVVLYFLKKPLWLAPIIALGLYLFYRVVILGLIFGLLNKVASSQVKKEKACDFDAAKQVAVVRASICNGERVAGFKDRETGHFTEVMLIRSDADLEKFKKMYGVDEVKTEY